MTRLGIYCGRCLRLVELGRDAGPCAGLEWIEACAWCLERDRAGRVEVDRLEEIWSARVCAAPDCGVAFAPASPTQRFCSDRCRKRTHRRAKAAALAAR